MTDEVKTALGGSEQVVAPASAPNPVAEVKVEPAKEVVLHESVTPGQAPETKKVEEKATPEPVKGAEGTKEGDTKSDPAKTGAPEKYEFKAPEGQTLDEELLTKFTPVAKELNLSQEQADKLVGLYNEKTAAMAQAQADAWTSTVTEWGETAKSDKEIGGAKFDESLATAKKFLSAYGTPELMTALNFTGVGNHPEFIRLFAKAGAALKEDSFRRSEGNGNSPKTAADVLYPNQGR